MKIYQVRQMLRMMSIYELDLRVVYYARVSSDKEEQKNSITNQKEYYEEFIRSNKKWKFCGGYVDDGISGMHAESREQFQRMIADAKLGKFDLIITKEISRFARNTLDSIQYTRQLLSYGVCVWFQNDNINTIDDDSEFRLTIMAGVAQDEIRKLSSRVRFGHAQAIKNGVVLGNSLIYGYDKKDGRLTINNDEAEMIRLIFEKYATGTWSTPKIEKLLYEKGYRNHKGGKIDRGVIKNIIRNPKYKGYYAGGKVKIVDMFTKKQEFLPESEWNMYKDDGTSVPAIVSEDLWERANFIYKKRGDEIKTRRSSFKTNNLFTGKIFCANDGKPYWMKQHYTRGKEDVRWVCSYKIKNGASSCNSFGISERELLNVIANVINSSDIDISKCVGEYVNLLKAIFVNSSSEIETEENIRSKISNVQKKMSKLLDYNLNGVITDEEFIEKNSRCKEELFDLEQKLSYHDQEEPSFDRIELRIKQIQKELKKYKGISSDEIDGTVIENLIDKIIVNPIGERKAKLSIVLNTGISKEDYLGCSGNMTQQVQNSKKFSETKGSSLSCSENTLFNILPEQHTVFYRDLRSFSRHKMPVEYTYSLAI